MLTFAPPSVPISPPTEGAMAKHLAGLGFKTVYNKCEDFYGVIHAKTVPLCAFTFLSVS